METSGVVAGAVAVVAVVDSQEEAADSQAVVVIAAAEGAAAGGDSHGIKDAMKTFLADVEEQAVVEEIRQLEMRTTGEVRVVITGKWIFRAERYAWKMFQRLGMRQTAARNGALIVVIQRRRRFVVLGDIGIAAVVGPGYWKMIADQISGHFVDGERLAALLAGIRLLGETMAEQWPPGETNTDELPNEIVRD